MLQREEARFPRLADQTTNTAAATSQLVRARAPLRLGLAGGGTDVSPYADTYGGCVLNGTINLYSYAIITPAQPGMVELHASDLGVSITLPATEELPLEEPLLLHRATYNRIVRDFAHRPLSLCLTTYSDAPPGSGLGTSSTLVVAMLRAFMEWLGLQLCPYELGQLAFVIERVDAGLGGGKQDQYAAVFGGFNFMEFYANDRVVINQLRVRQAIVSEFESCLILFDTGKSRHSAAIIAEQVRNVGDPASQNAVEAMHGIRKAAFGIKEALLKGDIGVLTDLFRQSWESKKRTACCISTDNINRVYERVMENGGRAGKVSGAGGGGFMMFLVDPLRRYDVLNMLQGEQGQVVPFHFVESGAQGWKVKEPGNRVR